MCENSPLCPNAPTLHDHINATSHNLVREGSRFVCVDCHASVGHHSPNLAYWLKSPCMAVPFDDSAAPVAVPGLLRIQLGNTFALSSLVFLCVRGILFCNSCGSYAAKKCNKLAHPCAQHCTVSSQLAKDKLHAVQLPTRKMVWPRLASCLMQPDMHRLQQQPDNLAHTSSFLTASEHVSVCSPLEDVLPVCSVPLIAEQALCPPGYLRAGVDRQRLCASACSLPQPFATDTPCELLDRPLVSSGASLSGNEPSSREGGAASMNGGVQFPGDPELVRFLENTSDNSAIARNICSHLSHFDDPEFDFGFDDEI